MIKYNELNDKKEYLAPSYEIEFFSIQNILTVSGSQDDHEEDDDDDNTGDDQNSQNNAENYDQDGKIF